MLAVWHPLSIQISLSLCYCVWSTVCVGALRCVCLKGYHIHIRSTSHNQKMAEAKKQKELGKKQSAETVSGTQSSPKPADVAVGRSVAATKPTQPPPAAVDKPGAFGGVSQPPAGGVKPLMSIETKPVSPKPVLKPANNESAADSESSVEKPARGPNYCDVCCFEFSSTEVCSLLVHSK